METLLVVGLALAVVALFVWLGSLSGPAPAKERLPEWYELTGETVAIRGYSNADDATADANRAAPFRWTVQSVTTSDGHINVGRTVSGAVLTGGISLLVGGSRTKGSVTVTFVRAATA